VLFILITAALVLAFFPLVYYLLSLCCVIGHFARLRRAKAGKEQFMPPASIIKPVRGVDHEAYENFASFCRLDYPEYEIVFGVTDKDDPIIPVIEKLRVDFPRRTIRLITNVPHLGTNEKINNLCQLAQKAKYDLLVMSDSDVRVEPDYLKAVVVPFANPEVGVVTALYKSLSAESVAERQTAPQSAAFLDRLRSAFGTLAMTRGLHGAGHAVLTTLYSRARRIGLDGTSCLLRSL
jgi:ceramide glucosyltransferase